MLVVNKESELKRMKLIELFDGLNHNSAGDLNVDVSGFTFDSRQVKPGYLFLAMKGEVADGHKFIPAAIEAGAIAVMSELEKPRGFKQVWIRVENAREAMARLAGNWYQHPDRQLTLVGITGTNGKTSSAAVIKEILEHSSGKTGSLGTISYTTASGKEKASLTTPEAPETLRLIREMVDSGCKAAVMEASSAAIHRQRVAGFAFDAVVFTNLSRDHLDYHGDMESYYLAKKELFLKDNYPGAVAVINISDESGRRLASETDLEVVTFGQTPAADIFLEHVDLSVNGIKMEIIFKGRKLAIESKLVGRFNVENILTAVATGLALGVDAEQIRTAVAKVEPVHGRFDLVPGDKEYQVLVDYAHTDDALLKLLEAANELAEGRVISVFGCGGDRDPGKRPVMGRHAVNLSDLAVLTSDNPRTEDPMAIIEDVMQGIRQLPQYRAELLVEADRRKAIFAAIARAGKGDLVVIAGKGHEDYQEINNVKTHFDDKEVAAEAMAEL
jgi:UDP-N-acetylmuramoyl-L-alanyl-D-glutamate--2,6-diaminopimelate ligase